LVSVVPTPKHEIAADVIGSLSLFNQADAPNLSALAEAAVLLSLPSHVVLLREGEQPKFFHVVLEGSVELFARSDDREVCMNVIRAGRALMPEAIVRNWPNLASARILEATRVVAIPAETVRNIYARDQVFARAMANEIADSCSEIFDEFRNQKLRTSLERFAWWILRTNTRYGSSGKFSIPYDRRTLASLLSMTPENLSRSIRTLIDYGVTVRGREVTLTDPSALIRLAKPSVIIEDLSRAETPSTSLVLDLDQGHPRSSAS
jgi:CRP/FNR family transcriptional activator FtrB